MDHIERREDLVHKYTVVDSYRKINKMVWVYLKTKITTLIMYEIGLILKKTLKIVSRVLVLPMISNLVKWKNRTLSLILVPQTKIITLKIIYLYYLNYNTYLGSRWRYRYDSRTEFCKTNTIPNIWTCIWHLLQKVFYIRLYCRIAKRNNICINYKFYLFENDIFDWLEFVSFRENFCLLYDWLLPSYQFGWYSTM